MWQRFTSAARQVLFAAQEEATKFGEGYVSTEHLLLGLVRDAESTAASVLSHLGLTREGVRRGVERQLPRGDAKQGQDMKLTPRGKRVIDHAYKEARELGDNYIGTEHLLLGLIAEGDGLAGRVLAGQGVDLEMARKAVREVRAGEPAEDTNIPIETTSPQERLLGFTGGVCIREHLILAMLADLEGKAGKAIRALCQDIGLLQWNLWCEIGRTEGGAYHPNDSKLLYEWLRLAQEEAASDPLQPYHLLLAVFHQDPTRLNQILATSGLAYEDLKDLLERI